MIPTTCAALLAALLLHTVPAGERELPSSSAAAAPVSVHATQPIGLGGDPRVRIGPATTPGDDATVYRITAPARTTWPPTSSARPGRRGSRSPRAT